MTTGRIIGLVLFAAALMFGAADLWHSYFPAYGSDALTLERIWLLLSARSMVTVESLVQGIWRPIWDEGFGPFLLVPAWGFCGVLGFLFFAFGRPKVEDR
ncbi:MAG TPA: hypothetical protein VMW18_04915 [Candidatus Binatia bacterium]|nr:hypothetical protein [Candidatus Binatia bacterium]